jgi:hypothetical protein
MSLAKWFADNFAGPISLPAEEPVRRAPRLAIASSAPSQDEFATWRDDPTTQFVFAALRAAAESQKVAWEDASWATGQANPLLLMELRTRADAYQSIENADYSALCEWLGLEEQA